MTALSNARNTTEILCHTQKLHRTRPLRDGVKIYTGSIVAINGTTNEAEPAADAAKLIVIGRAEGFTADGRVIDTVGKVGGTNHIRAGVLREIDADSQVIVEIGNQVIG